MTASIHQFRRRTNAHVMAEILIAQGELSRLRMVRMMQGRDLTLDEDDRWTVLEDQIEAAQAELVAMVERDTGMPWDALLGALS